MPQDDQNKPSIQPSDVVSAPRPTRFSDEDNGIINDAKKRIADRICMNIHLALVDNNLNSAANPVRSLEQYSDATRDLLVRAWTLAAQLKSSQVTIDHLVAALMGCTKNFAGDLSNLPATGAPYYLPGPDTPLFLSVETDTPYFLTGALLRIAVLNETIGPSSPDLINPELNALKWISAASEFAAEEKLEPDHFVNVVTSPASAGALQQMVRRALNEAARAGRPIGELAKARQKISSLGMTLSFFRSNTNTQFGIVKGLLKAGQQEVATLNGQITDAQTTLVSIQKDVTALGPILDDSKGTERHDNLKHALGECRNQLAAIIAVTGTLPLVLQGHVNGLRKELQVIETRLATLRPGNIDGDLAKSLAECRSDVEVLRAEIMSRQAVTDLAPVMKAVDDRAREIRNAIPRPPPPLRLMMAVVSALLLGVGLGYALPILAKGGSPIAALKQIFPGG
jgi:hypothetical protein